MARIPLRTWLCSREQFNRLYLSPTRHLLLLKQVVQEKRQVVVEVWPLGKQATLDVPDYVVLPGDPPGRWRGPR